jgi:hypothetical protein
VDAPIVAAGLDATITVPANTRWRLLGAYLDLTTSAAVANRIPAVVALIGSFFNAGTRVAPIVANTVSALTIFSPGQPTAEFLAAGAYFDPMSPPMLLTAGATIYTSITAIQAADQINLFSVYVEEWIEP